MSILYISHTRGSMLMVSVRHIIFLPGLAMSILLSIATTSHSFLLPPTTNLCQLGTPTIIPSVVTQVMSHDRCFKTGRDSFIKSSAQPQSEAITDTDNSGTTALRSHIVSLKSTHIPGMATFQDGNGSATVEIRLVTHGDNHSNYNNNHNNLHATSSEEDDSHYFIAVTGESGSGKSLLVSKAIDWVTGGSSKGLSAMISRQQGDTEQTHMGSACYAVELEVQLYEPHLSHVSTILKRLNIPLPIDGKNSNKHATLHIKRAILPLITNNNINGDTTAQKQQPRRASQVKSKCQINGKEISLKQLRQIASPLFTCVDIASAGNALAQETCRLNMIDMGVEATLRQECLTRREKYRDARRTREKIVQEWKKEEEARAHWSSALQSSTVGTRTEEEHMKVLQHWVDELDAFEARMHSFREVLLSQYSELLSEYAYHANNDKKIKGSSMHNFHHGYSSDLFGTLRTFQSITWGENESMNDISFYESLLVFREQLKKSYAQLSSAHSAYNMLSSLSSPDSVTVALEKVRSILYSISQEVTSASGPLLESIEKTHEQLNHLETILNDCAQTIDGNSDSVVTNLEKMICPGSISLEDIDVIVADWNALARKHGISPYMLPKCHESLRKELDGTADALSLLPKAEEDERIAKECYLTICKELSKAREIVAHNLSESVTRLLPSLGMEGSIFQVQMSLCKGGFEVPYCGTERIGVDMVDFLFLHNNDDSTNQVTNINENNGLKHQHGGCINQVGSSGEKSRVLLAIETSLPGSIGMACNAYLNSVENAQSIHALKVPPISIIYDEIDAHVGGRAAVTMAKLLANQTRRQSNHVNNTMRLGESGSQIIAITHSASLAAIATKHIVIERGNFSAGDSYSPVRAFAVDGSSRRKEIARMASGDLALREAETFADALIREALLQRENAQHQ